MAKPRAFLKSLGFELKPELTELVSDEVLKCVSPLCDHHAPLIAKNYFDIDESEISSECTLFWLIGSERLWDAYTLVRFLSAALRTPSQVSASGSRALVPLQSPLSNEWDSAFDDLIIDEGSKTFYERVDQKLDDFVRDNLEEFKEQIIESFPAFRADGEDFFYAAFPAHSAELFVPMRTLKILFGGLTDRVLRVPASAITDNTDANDPRFFGTYITEAVPALKTDTVGMRETVTALLDNFSLKESVQAARLL